MEHVRLLQSLSIGKSSRKLVQQVVTVTALRCGEIEGLDGGPDLEAEDQILAEAQIGAPLRIGAIDYVEDVVEAACSDCVAIGGKDDGSHVSIDDILLVNL